MKHYSYQATIGDSLNMTSIEILEENFRKYVFTISALVSNFGHLETVKIRKIASQLYIYSIHGFIMELFNSNQFNSFIPRKEGKREGREPSLIGWRLSVAFRRIGCWVIGRSRKASERAAAAVKY